ncbi:hypothetical protein L579_1048 [Pantoea sp. AS-PWVM4]|nr:hypothetical protein L579_1048 [Pantoea sp. AS-PWVM4]
MRKIHTSAHQMSQRYFPGFIALFSLTRRSKFPVYSQLA